MAIVKIDGIPVYDALITDEECGMLRISLVDSPAVMSDFVAFAGQKKQLMYAIENEEERKVLGVVMRADFPIYRYDRDRGEFYIIFKAETIKAMAEKYLLESRQNDVNLEHGEDTEVDGVQMVQYFIKDTAKGINPVGFDEIADGSLMAEFHVVNDDVWAEIKAGTYKGFSLEGIFELAPEQNEEEIEQIVERLDGKFDKLLKKFNMGKFKRFMAALEAAMLEEVAFGSMTTDKGVIEWEGDDDLKVGDAVYVKDENVERVAAPDGDYQVEDGRTIRIAEGKVAEIVDPVEDTEEVIEENNDDAESVELGEISTDKGKLYWKGDEDLVPGNEVFVDGEDGELAVAPDGDYATEDGKTIKVEDGKVAEITDAEAEVADQEEESFAKQAFSRIKTAFEQTYEEKISAMQKAIYESGVEYFYIVEASDEHCVICEYLPETDSARYVRYELTISEDGTVVLGDHYEVEETFVPVEEKVEDAIEEEELMASIKKLTDENASLKARNKELEEMSAAPSAHKAYKGGVKTKMNKCPKGKSALTKALGF